MPANDPLIGKTIGPYRIIKHMARGGMADVYLAEDVELQRRVVIKLILPHLAADETFVARFQREGQTTAQLEHPNIVRIYTTGRLADGRPYLVMQYISGGSLEDRLVAMNAENTRLSIVAALDMTRQIAGALDAAHQAGIVHRDLKPSNILLDKNDKPIITDLGIAQYAGGTRLTQTGSVMGTPHYMSPEQAGGKSLDGRSDIYSLGVILYELLASQRPFTGDSPIAVLHQHIYEPPPPLATIRPDLQPATYQVVEKALQKDPVGRFQTAAAMGAALNHALAAEQRFSTSTTPVDKIYPPAAIPTVIDTAPVREPAKERHKTWLWLLPLLLLLAVGLFWMSQRSWQFTIGSSASETKAGNELPIAIAETTSPTPTVTAVLPTATPQPTATTPPTETPQPSPTPIPPDPQIIFESNRDGDYDIYRMDIDGRNQQPLTINDTSDENPKVSPDGQHILFQSERDGNREIYVMDIDGRNQTRLTFNPGRDQVPTWSPDGSQIAFASDRSGNLNIHTMRANGSSLRQLTFDDLLSGHPTWSINDEIAFNAGQNDGDTWEIYVMDSEGQNARQLTDNGVSDWSPEWSPDGRSILYLHSLSKTDEAAIFIMNTDGSDQRLLFTTDDYEWGAHWTPDGRHILFTRAQGNTNAIYKMDAFGNNVTYISERGSYPNWVE